MDTGMEMDERLWSYIDGGGSEAERSAIDRLIREHAEWRAKYEELLEFNSLLAGSTELEEPSLRFTRNVMEEIARQQITPATRNYINKRIIWGIAAVFGLLMIGFLVYAIGIIDWSVPTRNPAPMGLDLNKTDYSRIWNSDYANIFMMVNALLCLLLLERFLSSKRRQRLDGMS